MMMTRIGDQKRRNEAVFLAHHGGGSSGDGAGSSCGVASAKRSKTGAAGGGPRVPVSPSASSSSSSSRERKDKIGERVAALQQLVSPYGKTDTASVLQEATGYIKFLHDQVQVLSAPYLRTPPLEPSQGYSLRSRGLCLVPVECTATLPSTIGADLWAPTNANTNTTTSWSPRF